MAELCIPRNSRFKSDQIMHEINRKFISLNDEEKRIQNQHLKNVLDEFIKEMKANDPMFSACYQKLAYVGSFYEGLKVGKPEEFDLNVVINLPIDYSRLTVQAASEKSGYVKIKADADVLPDLKENSKWKEYKVMKSWFAENSYLNQNKFRDWFESVATKAYNSVTNYYGMLSAAAMIVTIMNNTYTLKHRKSGPAWTLIIGVPGGHTVDVDLVPVLEFTTPPPEPFIDRNTKKQNWFTISKPFVLPKPLNDHILWRPSFYYREREILEGSSKPAIRLMKKLRDTQKWPVIASYWIKTLFLWEFEKRKLEFEKWSLTSLFYHMLNKLQKACENHKILDFWNRENNLLSEISSPRLDDISHRLIIIIKDIDLRIATDPYVIAKFIVTKAEFEQLKQSVVNAEMASTSWVPTYDPDVEEEEEEEKLEPWEMISQMDSMSLTPRTRAVVPESNWQTAACVVGIAGAAIGACVLAKIIADARRNNSR